MTANDPTSSQTAGGVSRRAVLGVGAAGAGAALLAACTRAPAPATPAAPASSAPAQTSNSSATSSSAAHSATGAASASSSAASGPVLADLSQIKVGSAIAAKGTDGSDILISRTGETTVAAFSAICPHQGCTVADSFVCPCHGSSFDPKTGARISGPTPSGLRTVPVSVSGDNVVAG
jgi:Rieske Fe-S protein